MNKKLYWIAIFLFCLFLACLSTNYDYDLFARLIVGERFIEEGLLPFKDFLSYTPTHDWFDHEWGSGVIFYIILKHFGAFGIVMFQALCMLFTTFFIIKFQKLQRYTLSVSFTYIIVFLLCFYSLNSWLIRCQLFSFLFFSIFLYLLEKHRKTGSKIIWLIPLITILWNNIHGGVVAGLGLIFLYLAGSLLEKKSYSAYLLILVISLLSLIINPYGIKYISFLFSAVTMSRKYIVEWASPLHSYHIKKYIPVFVYVLFGSVIYIYNNLKTKNIDYTKILILSATAIEGLMHVKMLSFGVISVTAISYNEISMLFKPLKKYTKIAEKSLFAAVFFISLSIPLFSPQVPRLSVNLYPIQEVEFLKLNNIKGNLLTSFEIGSYVSYKLYPDNLIYMDGRYEEVYNDKEFLALKSYELGQQDWQDIIKNYHTEILMPRKNLKIYQILSNDPDWIEIYNGPLFGIFIEKNNPYINKTLILPEYDINYYRHNMFKGNKWGNKIS